MKQYTAIAWVTGVLASAILFGLYLLVLTFSNSWGHAWSQYLLLKWWMTPLIVLFGVQVGLFMFLRGALKARHASGAAAGAIATSGGVSTGAMIACCMHHVTDVLPIIGLSAAAVFLNAYQEAFLLLGILSSLLGLVWMLKTADEHRIAENGLLSRVLAIPWKRIFTPLFFTSIFVLAIKVFIIIRT